MHQFLLKVLSMYTTWSIVILLIAMYYPHLHLLRGFVFCNSLLVFTYTNAIQTLKHKSAINMFRAVGIMDIKLIYLIDLLAHIIPVFISIQWIKYVSVLTILLPLFLMITYSMLANPEWTYGAGYTNNAFYQIIVAAMYLLFCFTLFRVSKIVETYTNTTSTTKSKQINHYLFQNSENHS